MRRRRPSLQVGAPVPFVAPEGDYRAVWAAYEAWEAALGEWLTAHPADAEAAAEVRLVTRVPDAPFDVRSL